MQKKLRFGSLINRVVGLLLLFFGLWVMFDPSIFERKYGLLATSGDAQSTLMAVVGGTEIALGMLFLRPLFFGLSDGILHRVGLSIFGTIVTVRVGYAFLGDPISNELFREMMFEILIVFVFLISIFPRR